MLLDTGPCPEQVGIRTDSMCVLDNTRPSDYEGVFIIAGDSKTRKGLAYKRQQERLGWAALVF